MLNIKNRFFIYIELKLVLIYQMTKLRLSPEVKVQKSIKWV